ncbi:MAG: phosphodiester glycosidase family protein, partial [Anaeroplasma bactoclasticum]|nr:phosphodiester glycosidase family protein [Anaeroplasma bactoclasticum]
MKKLIVGISLFSILMMGCIATVEATSPHISKQVLVEEERLNANLQYQYYQMDTSYDVAAAKVKRDVYTYTLDPSQDVKLAVWTYSSTSGYEKKTLAAIGEDYEKNHPGWIVLGGVNAEGYYNDEPTNAIVQDGEVIRKDVSAEAFKELIGFKADGSVVIKQRPVASNTPRLKVDNESYDVTKVNALPDENGISIILPDMMQSIDATGYRVFEINYAMYRKSSQFPAGTLSGDFLGIFVKGIVNQELTEVGAIGTPPSKKVYIITKNATVTAHFSKGKEILCQFEYIDEFSDVECMTGYMYKYLENGESIPVSYVDTNDMGQSVVYNCEYYKTTSKERAGIGFKADGSIVILTANTKTGGPTQFEVAEMFKELGCVNAYQFDGGGSVTFLKRDAEGKLQMLNTPGDGHPRSIMTGLFIVARDPGLNSKYAESTP